MFLLAARLLDRDELTLVVLVPADVHGHDAGEIAVGITIESLHGSQIDARVRTELRCSLFLAVIHLVDLGPFGPRVVRGAIHGRHRHDLELRERLAALAHGSADAVSAGVTTA